MALCYFSGFISIFSHILFLAAQDKLLRWKTYLLLFILNLLLLFTSCLLTQPLPMSLSRLGPFLCETFPGSHSGSQMIRAPVSRCCERIYHSVVQSLAYLTVVLLDKPWAYSKGEIFVFFVISTQNTRRSMFVECIMNKWLYLKDWSRPLAPAFPVMLRNSLNFNASFCSFTG